MKNKETLEIPFIPVSIMGMTCVIRGNRITFINGSIRERMDFCNGNWVYTNGERIRVIVDTAEMDAILIGWYTQFDHSGTGLCVISIRALRDGDITEITYRN